MLLPLILAASGSAATEVREGGTFRIAVAAGYFTTIDPALVDNAAEAQVLDPACAPLTSFVNRRLRPELAEKMPSVSRDGLTYTVTVRREARFSNGAAVTARHFAHALQRAFEPALRDRSDIYVSSFGDVDGAADMLAGKATRLRGVTARGRKLTLRLTTRVPDLPTRLSLLCAMPTNVPADPEGADAPLPSPAPYYIAEYIPGERLVLERNRRYRGPRPQHLDRIVAGTLAGDPQALLADVASGRLHWAWTPQTEREQSRALKRRYGINKSQFYVRPGTFLRMFVLNTSRPLFRENPRLRRAVNLAVNRTALTGALGYLAGTPTDQYLSPADPGWRNARIYPLNRPDLTTARKLAQGNLRSGRAVLYTRSDPVDLAQAHVLQQNLSAIGLTVEIKAFPGTQIFDKLREEGHLFDIGRVAWSHADDACWFARPDGIFDRRTIGQPTNTNWSYFDSPRYARLFAEAHSLGGDARVRACGALDVQLSRDAAPAIPIANLNAFTFVSAQVDCVFTRPFFDLGAACLK